jgi:hypothetical protein
MCTSAIIWDFAGETEERKARSRRRTDIFFVLGISN